MLIVVVGWRPGCENELRRRFMSRILPVDDAQPLPAIDARLAATALQHDLTVVSRNVRDFRERGSRSSTRGGHDPRRRARTRSRAFVGTR